MALERFPGFIDVHVHLREPGATHKEDFYTGTRAAVKGGFTFVIDMPNNPSPTISLERLDEKIRLAKQKAVCEVGFHYGTNGNNTETFRAAADFPQVFGLKVYCNHTTGEMLIEHRETLEKVFASWESEKPILVHAEKEKLYMALELAAKFGRRLHVCHISSAGEVQTVREAKMRGEKVTAGVTPHHLFMTEKDRAEKNGFAMMKPPLETEADRGALWKGISDGTIDLVETDHAPHTKEEKTKEPPAFGVPGLESAAGLLGLAARQNKIAVADIARLLHDNPRKIFNIPDRPDSYAEIDFEESYIFPDGGYETKCGWSPFEGWKLWGKVRNAAVKGKKVLENGKFTIS